jgi:uncharacterized membrane protein YedE/YeeE
MQLHWIVATLGGALIGGASALLLLAHGRIAGISGITAGVIAPETTDRSWRLAFVGGLLLAGALAALLVPSAIGASPRGTVGLVIAGLLVGIGTRLGSGCTSGHGICGLSRGSKRSLLAVMTFMFTGAITATLVGRLS